jgi:uncharacterized FlaG/YvyC family protein
LNYLFAQLLLTHRSPEKQRQQVSKILAKKQFDEGKIKQQAQQKIKHRVVRSPVILLGPNMDRFPQKIEKGLSFQKVQNSDRQVIEIWV